MVRSRRNRSRGGGLSVTGAAVGRDLTLNQLIVQGDLVPGGAVDPIDLAARRLAESVRALVLQETSRQSLWVPAPLPVRWSPTGRPVQSSAAVLHGTGTGDDEPPGLRGELREITAAWRRLPHRQLVILGAPGSGKTVLAMLLMLDLLEEPEEDDPIPVLFSLASYRPGTSLQEWMADRLAEDHPYLADAASFGSDAAARLVGTGRVMPVLDGLDEIPEGLRAEAVAEIEHALAARSPLVLTCRTEEYETAVTASGRRLTRAAVVELEKVGADTAVRFLRAAAGDGDERWEPLFEEMLASPEGVLARTFETPLMLFLARSAYDDPATSPSELLDRDRFPGRKELEGHLLASFVPAVYAPYRRPARSGGTRGGGAGAPSPEKAGRWLGFLARGGRDLRWWQFRSPVVNVTTGLIFAGSAYMFHLVWGIRAGIAGGLITGVIAAGTCTAGIYDRPEVREDPTRSPDLRSSLRRHRAAAALWATLSGVAVGAVVGLWFAGGVGAGPGTTIGHAVGCGTMFGLGTLVSTAWGGYLLTRLWYAMTGRLPWRLPAFLDDAHERSALRRIGSVYQFRHARLQDALREGRGDVFRTAPEAPPPRGLRRIVTSVPLVRLGGQIGAIVLPVALFTVAIDQDSIAHTYRSGTRPGRYNAVATGCTGVPCPPLPVLVWRVPRGAAVTTVFSLRKGRSRLPYRSLAGFVKIDGCSSARLEITVRAGDPQRTLRAVGRAGGFPLQGRLRGRLPAEVTSLSLTLRRLDRSACTAEVHLQNPTVTRDQLFDIRNRFG